MIRRPVIETAGGLFSPLTDDGGTNAELVRRIEGGRLVLVAADRLGVLHDVEACRRAAVATGLTVDAIVSNRMLELLDESVGTNLEDLRARSTCPVVGFDGELDAQAAATLRALLA